MNTCPFCPGKLYPTFTNSISREKCGRCNAVWVEGEALADLVGTSAAQALVEKTQGKPGKCRQCSASLPGVNPCPRCGHEAATCPRCGAAPMAVAGVEGVRVDVCSTCHGMALDEPGFDQLRKIVAARRPPKPTPKQASAPPLTKAACCKCQRKLLLKHAFTHDGKLYCGSCAPRDATPFTVEMAKASPALAPALSAYLTGDEEPPATSEPSRSGFFRKASKPPKE